MKKIHSHSVLNGTVKVLNKENCRPLSIKHATEYHKHFPDIDHRLPSKLY